MAIKIIGASSLDWFVGAPSTIHIINITFFKLNSHAYDLLVIIYATNFIKKLIWDIIDCAYNSENI